MLSDIVEKRINEISTISDELSYIVPRDGWTDYAIGLAARMQKMAIILDDEDDGAEARIDEILSGAHEDDGNTRLPFGLCEREGIKIDPSWTPRDAWAALEKKGYNVSETYNELRETGSVAERERNVPQSRGRNRYPALTDDIYDALKSGPNEAVFFSGCSRRDEYGNVIKKSQEVAREYAGKNSGVTMELLLEKNKEISSRWNSRNMDGLSKWADASRAYAEQAVGDVRVLARKPLRKGNIFESIEFPTLKENPNVTSVTMIDVDTGEETVLFRR